MLKQFSLYQGGLIKCILSLSRFKLLGVTVTSTRVEFLESKILHYLLVTGLTQDDRKLS